MLIFDLADGHEYCSAKPNSGMLSISRLIVVPVRAASGSHADVARLAETSNGA